MRQCDRCGEPNSDDARYCGTCGLAMPEQGSIESLVDLPDPASIVDQDVDTASGMGPGGARRGSSEYVGAPTFGETGPVTGPPPGPIVTGVSTVAPPPTGSAPTVCPSGDITSGASMSASVPPTRSSRSTSVMIATLAVASVVIIGGVLILLSAGSGGTEFARTGDEHSGPRTAVETAPADVIAAQNDSAPSLLPDTVLPDTVLPDTVLPDTVSLDTIPLDTVRPGTIPPASTPETVPGPTVAPIPAPTLPPLPAPTAPPTPSRGPGDLGLNQPILDETCDGRYITFVGSAIGDRPYRSVVDELLDLYPGANYIWTKACSSLRQEFTNGADIYGVVFGPYLTQQEACSARDAGPVDAYVRRISTLDPPDHTILC